MYLSDQGQNILFGADGTARRIGPCLVPALYNVTIIIIINSIISTINIVYIIIIC